MTEEEKRAYYTAARRDYIAKNDDLFEHDSWGWRYIPPQEFYDRLFEGVELEQPGGGPSWDEPGGGRPNAIAIEITNERKAVERHGKSVEVPVVHRYTLSDGFDMEPVFRKSLAENTTWFCAPVTYFGRRRTAANARYLHALTVDLDGVDAERLHLVIYQMHRGIFPQASAIVNSGTGVHLYYFLDRPVPLYPRNVPWLQALKHALTDRVWNEDTSALPDRQYQGIYQAFRMPGTTTKINGARPWSKERMKYEAVAFAHMEGLKMTRVSLEYLRSMVAIPKASPISQPLALFKPPSTPIGEAREKWPGWYERRIVNGEGPGSWTCDRALYDWWLRVLREPGKVTYHHRYRCLRALKAFADKCGIARDELVEDAFSFLKPFEDLTEDPENHFTESDVIAAIDSEDGTRLTRDFIESSTAIALPPRAKRNGRTQEQHLKIARFARDLNYENGRNWYDGGGRPKGSGTKAEAVRSYAAEHPEANHSEIARALGVSRTTVVKWLKG